MSSPESANDEKKPVFISHATADKAVVDMLVDLIETGMGISHSKIFCTALEGMGIPPGSNFIEFIRGQIQRPKAVVLLLTQTYVTRPFCLAELGAAWAMGHQVFPLVLPPLRVGDLGDVLANSQMLRLDDPYALSQLREELTTALGVVLGNLQRWEVKRDQFLEKLRNIKPDAPMWTGSVVPKDVRSAIEGLWRAAFTYVDGQTYEEIIEVQCVAADQYLGRIVPSLDNCEHSGEVDHLRPVRLKGSFGSGQSLIGIWYHSSRPGLQGAFQVRMLPEDDSVVGGWLMFSESRNSIITERWEWQRRRTRGSPVIGVYGITGAGKTALCRELVKHLSHCRFFSESDVIDQYMRRFENGTLGEFKQKSESERMNAREEAFKFHCERVKNSYGILLGDAHYSFPSVRLGRIEKAHPEAENGIQPVMPQAAWKLYQGILYLDTPPEIVKERLLKRAARDQRNDWAAALSVEDLGKWLEYEKRKLGAECARCGKQFFKVPGEGTIPELAARAQKLIDNMEMKAY